MAEILIIDDEEPVRFTIRNILEFGGHDVREASSGREALSALRQQCPDMVLCDITMPEMTGYDVLKELRTNHPNMADLPFVFLSALAGRGDVLEGLKLGADDYLSKPIDHEMLLAKVEATLRQVLRIDEKKKREQVKLYKALTQEADNRDPDDTSRSAEPQPSAAVAKPDVPAFERRLGELLRGGAGGTAGRLRFINLAELKERVGDRWDKVSRKVIDIAEGIIRRHLTPGAIFHRYNLEVFFLVFPDLPEEQAVLKIESIADEICAKLLGQSEEGYRQLSLTSTSMEMRALAEKCGASTLTALMGAFDADAAPERDHATVAGNDSSAIRERAIVKYQPIWSPDAEKIVAYQVRCRLPNANQAALAASPGDAGSGTPDPNHLDRLLAERVAIYFRASAREAERAAVCLPIHLTSLIGERRSDIERQLELVPMAQLKASLVIEVVPPPSALEAAGAVEALAFVKRRCRFLVMRCSARHPQLSLFAKSGVASLSMQFQAPSSNTDQGSSERDLGVFARETHALGLEPYVHGLETLGSVRAAVKARFRLMAGQAIAPEHDRPGGAQLLRRNQVFIG